jgi:hypothetical protein
MLHYLAHKGAPELLKLYLHYTPFKFFIVSYGVLQMATDACVDVMVEHMLE